jgi:hypothetical protein
VPELLSNVQADTEAGARVAENVLACVAHMCVHNNSALRNSKRAIVALNLTGNTCLQHTTYAHVCSCMPTYAHTCSRMLKRTGNARVQDTCSPPANSELIAQVVRHCQASEPVVSAQAVFCVLHRRRPATTPLC